VSRVLVLSPHPDDESIGCGGSLRKHVMDGDEVRIVFLTSGEAGGHGLAPKEAAAKREAEGHAAAAVLGVDGVEFWRLPDGALSVSPEGVARLRRVLEEWRPETVYAPHDAEMHPDHRATYALLRAALDRGGEAVNDVAVRLYEIWTPLQRMDVIVDITPFIEVKLEAIRRHESQVGVMRLDEAAAGLSRYRGEMHSWPGGPYAEVFRTLT
jgi:LmbE family N-acetylglucosaminyl deacetylase